MKLLTFITGPVKKTFSGLGIIKLPVNDIADIELLNNAKVEAFCMACYLAGLHGDSFREVYDNLKDKHSR